MFKTNRGRGGQPGNRNAAKKSKEARINDLWKMIEEREKDEAMQIHVDLNIKTNNERM